MSNASIFLKDTQAYYHPTWSQYIDYKVLNIQFDVPKLLSLGNRAVPKTLLRGKHVWVFRHKKIVRHPLIRTLVNDPLDGHLAPGVRGVDMKVKWGAQNYDKGDGASLRCGDFRKAMRRALAVV